MELEHRAQIIKAHPFFQALSDKDLNELADAAIEYHYSPEQTLVTEGDIIDAVYIVVSGDIEVDVNHVPKRILHPGEAIGLTEAGFYSHSGLRTATLVAVNEVVIIGWAIEAFNGFLKRHPEYQEAMQLSAEKMLRANFIQQAVPFADLPGPAVMQLAETIKEIPFEEGTTLFQQGDIAAECYLITAGQIEISIKDQNGRERLVDTLGRGRLFGESAILGNPQRNASARVAESARLLVLKAEQINALVHHPHTAEALMGLVAEHWHPQKREGIENFHRESDEGTPVIILKNKAMGRYYQLSDVGWFVWQQLDGIKNLQEIAIELFKERQIFAPQNVADLILNLAEAGFVKLPELRPTAPISTTETLSLGQCIRKFYHEWRYLRWMNENIDPVLTRVYNKGVFILFAWPVQILILLMVLGGAIAFVYSLSKIPAQSTSFAFLFIGCVCVFAANVLSTVVHEFAHGLTVKHFKHEVHRAGIVFGWIGIAAYVDTSDMWLSPRMPRVIVSLAGPYSDLVMAGVAGLVAFFMGGDSAVSLFFLLLAMMLYYSAIKNLNPLIENDGYAALKDALGVQQLHAVAVAWLKREELPKLPYYRHAKIFWLVVCGIFVLYELSALLFQKLLFSMLPETVLGIATRNLVWILPVLVACNFAWIIVKSLKRH